MSIIDHVTALLPSSRPITPDSLASELITAVTRQKEKQVLELLSLGADPNHSVVVGLFEAHDALFESIEQRNPRMLSVLLDHKAKITEEHIRVAVVYAQQDSDADHTKFPSAMKVVKILRDRGAYFSADQQAAIGSLSKRIITPPVSRHRRIGR